ncbi:hypothetical protein CO655_13940 [Rhizobium sp. M1]|nr:hypothetical protein CO655_13940 [Rhizobium sp. M1]
MRSRTASEHASHDYRGLAITEVDAPITPQLVDRRAMRSLALTVCAVFSVLALSGGIFLGAFLIMSPSGGGFFPNLGAVLGLLVLGTGNLVSSICNGIYWCFGRAPRWLRMVTLAQSLPTLLFAGLLIFGMDPVS